MSKQYKRNFLKQVLVRIDFLNPLQNYEDGLKDSTFKVIKKTFPIRIHQKSREQTVQITGSKTNILTTEKTLWTYYSKNRKKHVRFEPNSFYIQYDKYTSFNVLKKDFSTIFKAVEDGYGPQTIGRLGLRYIDEIEIKEGDLFDWKDYFNPKLYSALSIPTAKEQQSISRAFSNLEFNYGDYQLILKYGMYNPDYPSPIKRKVFIIDTDAYKHDIIPNDNVMLLLEEFHNKISALFEKNIRDGLRRAMDGS